MVSFPFKKYDNNIQPDIDDASLYRSESTRKLSNAYELADLENEGSYSGARSSTYTDPYGDRVPLTEVENSIDPWSQNPQPYEPPLQVAVQPDTPRPAPPIGFSGIITDAKKGRIPWFIIFISVIQIAVFAAEMVIMAKNTGSPIATQPTLNPFIGPSSYLLIHMGARFSPCMEYVSGITDDSSLEFPCLSSTSVDTNICTLSELCGMGGVGSHPNQWWRFFTPLFLHAGLIHIISNFLMQFSLGIFMERTIGTFKFAFIYIAAGINGFLLSGNYALIGLTSCGASGALFGVLALQLVDLFQNWPEYQHRKRYLVFTGIEVVFYFALGLLPGIDNFVHIGGFAMGVILGIALLRSPMKIREKTGSSDVSYYSSQSSRRWTTMMLNVKNTFTGRSPWWYLWVLVRLFMLAVAAMLMIVLLRDFYTKHTSCSWCRYISCLVRQEIVSLSWRWRLTRLLADSKLV
ncbi:uncharacterized protein V1518DRAFT_417893 [Limtongia smithiae]|uniref:uncharacterized protein n=1 Tax=Limtongia smithiae TaxID=1125753 RepID=UPI0034CE5522